MTLHKCQTNVRKEAQRRDLYCFYLQLLSDPERTPLDSLKDRHIHHPKHKVYEADVQNLTEKVEGYVSIGAAALNHHPRGTCGKTNFFTSIFSGWRSECTISTSLWGSLIKLCGKKWAAIQRRRYVHWFYVGLIYTAHGSVTNSYRGRIYGAAQIFRDQTEREKQLLQKSQQSSVSSDEGGVVLRSRAG